MDVNISEEIWKFFSAMSISEQFLIEEGTESNQKLQKVIDILGRESVGPGLQLHIYDDGSVERKYSIN